MAIVANTYITPTVKGKKEDFQDFISNIDPTDCPFTDMCAATSAHNTYFQWQTDTLAAPAPNAQIEGDSLAPGALIATVEVGNQQQISSKTATVSRTMDQVSRYGRNGELAYQIVKQTKALKRDIEKQLTSNLPAVARATATAGVTGGLECWFTSNVDRGATGTSGGFTAAPGPVAPTDGTARALTEALIKNVLLQVFNNGGNSDRIMTDPFHKQVLSTALVGGQTRFVDADEKKLYATIGAYESDFGILKIFPNRFQRFVSTSKGNAFILDPEMWKISWVDPIHVVDRPLTADVVAFKQIVGEYGLMSVNEKGSGVVADLS